jgi:hypothetical protein
LAFYQTFTGVWPNDSTLVNCYAALLNGPVANAFVSVTEGKIDIKKATLLQIPVPEFSKSDRQEIDGLVAAYQEARRSVPLSKAPDDPLADSILRRIDAVVLRAYNFPPRVERELLDYFNGERRIVPFKFADYFPEDFGPSFSLGDYLSHDFSKSRISHVLALPQPAPEIMDVLKAASEMHGE